VVESIVGVAEALTDEAIVARLAVGDTREFPVLVDRYRKRVFAVLLRATGRRQDAEDLFQETWIRVARRAASFDPERPFAGWIARIATNLAIDWMRATRTRANVAGVIDHEASDRAPSNTPNAVDGLVAENEWRSVSDALGKLPERMREAIMLRYFEGQSEDAMADQLGIPHGTVKSRLSSAIAALRRTLASRENDDVHA
jgi:RNA polymerase sigma-70 factor (ECF subfamily)